MKLSRETNVGELRIFLKSRSCKEIRDRLRAVIERRKGFSFRKIADKIERSVSYVKTWNDRFKKEGALGLLDKNRDNKKSAPEANLKQIKQVLLKYFDPKNELSCIKTKDIQKLFQEELNLKRSASSVKKILKKLGYRYIKPRRQHEKNNPKAMKTWEEQDLPVFLQDIKLNYRDKKIEIWFQDESRFGQKTRITRQWTPPGLNPRIITQNGFGNCYIYGAVNPHNGSHVGLISSHCDTEIMNLHLKEISQSLAQEAHIVLILDGAGWHRSNSLSIPTNMTLFHLPPYSPELNPIERLWLWLKDNFLSNRIMKDLSHMIDLGTEAWKQITKDKVESICRVKYITL